MSEFIPQMEPLITADDREAVSAYLASGGWLTEFERTREFEKQIAGYTGARFCTTTPNGTLALFLALSGCGIGPGDEVIVPALTMAATATSVLLAGAQVVFADIESATLCLDLRAAERQFTSRTKAVIFVSLNGRAPAGLADFVTQCRARSITVIEDAAQSLGSFTGGRHLGTIGDCGCLSFSSQKVVTTGQGGAVVTNDEAIFDRMRMRRDFGRLKGGSDHYLEVGWNLKFTDLQAVLGVEQMRRLPDIVVRKRQQYERYRQCLSGVSGVRLLNTDLAATTPWFVDILVDRDTRPALMGYLREHGVGSREFYPALNTTPALRSDVSCEVAEAIAQQGLWLPSSLRLTDADIDRVCLAIAQFFGSRSI